MRQEDFNRLDDNNMTCLMNAIIHQPELFNQLHKSNYCTTELFNNNHERCTPTFSFKSFAHYFAASWAINNDWRTTIQI